MYYVSICIVTPVLTRKAWELNNMSGQWTFLMESFEEEKCRRYYQRHCALHFGFSTVARELAVLWVLCTCARILTNIVLQNDLVNSRLCSVYFKKDICQLPQQLLECVSAFCGSSLLPVAVVP